MHEKKYDDAFSGTNLPTYCGYATCFSADDLADEELYDDAKAELLAHDLASGKTFRYRTEAEVNGISYSDPVDESGESRLTNIFLNDNGNLTPERRTMILDAISTVESQMGVRLFNAEVEDIYLSQFVVDDLESLQNRNLWHGHIYHRDSTFKYNASTATHTAPDKSGQLIEGDSYEELTLKLGVRGGITFSFGTAMATSSEDCGSYKANFSTFPFNGGNTGYKLDKQDHITNSNWHFVHLGQDNESCNNMNTIDKDIVMHELGHAIGLNAHFEGFGIDGIWDERAVAVLRSIYNHPTATPFNELTVVE